VKGEGIILPRRAGRADLLASPWEGGGEGHLELLLEKGAMRKGGRGGSASYLGEGTNIGSQDALKRKFHLDFGLPGS
jgi:hypothetical protein